MELLKLLCMSAAVNAQSMKRQSDKPEVKYSIQALEDAILLDNRKSGGLQHQTVSQVGIVAGKGIQLTRYQPMLPWNVSLPFLVKLSNTFQHQTNGCTSNANTSKENGLRTKVVNEWHF